MILHTRLKSQNKSKLLKYEWRLKQKQSLNAKTNFKDRGFALAVKKQRFQPKQMWSNSFYTAILNERSHLATKQTNSLRLSKNISYNLMSFAAWISPGPKTIGDTKSVYNQKETDQNLHFGSKIPGTSTWNYVIRHLMRNEIHLVMSA